MKLFLSSISNSPIFMFLAGIASIISLVISINNDQFFYWILFTVVTFIFLQLIYLISVNSKMVEDSRMMLGKMDVVSLSIFDSKIDLEEDDNGKYFSNADLFLVIQSSLTPDKMQKNPIAIIQLQYPSQLKMKFSWRNHIIKQRDESNNSCFFEVPLGTGVEFIAVRSIHLKDGEEDTFMASSKKIDILLTCDSLGENITYSIPISNVGW